MNVIPESEKSHSVAMRTVAANSKTGLHLVWVFAGSLEASLDAATWLETTAALRRQGWRVTLIDAGDQGLHQVRGVEVLSFPKPDTYLVRQELFHRAIVRYIRQHWDDIDVVLFHQMSTPWMLPLKARRGASGRKRPLFVMDTRTVPMTVVSLKDRVRSLFDNGMNRAANRWVDGQTAITSRMAEAVGIPPQHLWGVWPSGVNADQFASARQHHWPVDDEPIQLIYVGAIFQERNLMGLCRAVEAANAAGLPFEFTIVGDGPEREALADCAAGTEGRIRVLPPVAHAQVPDLLAQAHVGVLPFPDEPKFRVSSPIKLFEYMAAGMPILATRIVCHTDVVGDIPIAFWAEPNGDEGLYAALARCWQAREELRAMGERSAVTVNDWTWTAAAHKLSDALTYGLETAPVEKSKSAAMTTESMPHS